MSDDMRERATLKPTEQLPAQPPPTWLTGLLEEIRSDRAEVMALARKLESRLDQLDRIEANQELMGRAVDEMRGEMRARIGAHDGELERGAKRFAEQDKRLADHERRIAALELAEQARKDDGK